MTKREIAITSLKIAGYHGNSKDWTRTYIESKVSRKVADEAWALGESMKERGVPCNCLSCK